MLDWSKFKALSGLDAINFEKICRGIVRRHFGSCGQFHELKNQPGVEYFIELKKDHPRLGGKGEIVGWQCKWFEYKSNKGLNSSAKQQIEHSLKTTKKHISNLNHWILWTHKTLTKVDQDWYYSLKSEYDFELYLWTSEDLDELLSGPAIDLRQTYFGELALTSVMLEKQHEVSVAPVKGRWVTEAHQKMELEHEVRQILGEKKAWNSFLEPQKSLEKIACFIREVSKEIEYKKWHEELQCFSLICFDFVFFCSLFEKSISGRDIEKINEMADAANRDSLHIIYFVLRRLRRANLSLSVPVSNALAYIKDIKYLLRSAQCRFSNQFVAVVADAGGGKTQFSAELTSASRDRPAGIFILGRSLKSGDSLNTLAQSIFFHGEQVKSFEFLIAALDSAADRAGCRLPIVIDGLNESQDPREWKDLLASIQPILKKYINVVMICTLRTGEKNRELTNFRTNKSNESRESFARQTLPDNSYIIESEGFSGDITVKAINAYFKLYKIEADPYSAPQNFFSHPLNLKIFCEVTNPKIEKIVHITYFPSSIYGLFEKLIAHTASTISNMTNLSRAYCEDDVNKALFILGGNLWSEGVRSISETKFRNTLGFIEGSWEGDIVNLLAQEGIIFRDDSETPYEYLLTPVYDRFGGYLIANYLLSLNKREEQSEWMQEHDFIRATFGEILDQHELSQDILHALIALAPKKNSRQQVWQSLPKKYVNYALNLSHLIDSNELCSETREAYKALIKKEKLPNKILKQLMQIRTVVGHPLNADFLSEVLFELSLVDRDLSWTEENRTYHQERIRAIKLLVQNLKNGSDGNAEVYRLRMLSVSWLLTTSVIDLRDLVTEALFLYGLQEPRTLFEITKQLLAVNDPYVLERLLAACYGVVGSLLLEKEVDPCVQGFANYLYCSMFVEGAEASTTHILSREYASCILLAVSKVIPEASGNWQIENYTSPFVSMPRSSRIVQEVEADSSEDSSPLRMDFENYTVGRLVRDRGNYDYNHPEYKKIRCSVLFRIKQLGWRANLFKRVDSSIESSGSYSRGVRPKIERYGKKYSWIAYYEVAGLLSDEERLDYFGASRFATDIDPFFPQSLDNVENKKIDKSLYLGQNITTNEWINDCSPINLSNTLEPDEIDGVAGPWVLLNARIANKSKRLNRNFYFTLTSYFMTEGVRLTLVDYLSQGKKIKWPEKPSSGQLYSGEIYSGYKEEVEVNSNIEVTIGHEFKKYKVNQLKINGKVLVKEGEKTISTPVVEAFKVTMLCLEYYWEYASSSYSSMDYTLLSPWLVGKLNLKFNASKLSYMDQETEGIVKFIDTKGDEFGQYQELMYIKKDRIEELCKIEGVSFTRKVYVEKQKECLNRSSDNINGDIATNNFEYLIE